MNHPPVYPAQPPLRGVLRARAEDFLVDELPKFVPEGEGEHLWLRIRKRDWNTERVADVLARQAGVPRRSVGYAGLKDRHAVTTQWFSLHLPGRADPDWDGLPGGIEVLEAVRHRRKLQTGALAGNRFTLRLTACEGDREAAEALLRGIAVRGVPNYFGEQRFGRDAGNLDRARAMFAGDLQVRDRHLRGIYLSAARSALFNAVLAARVAEGSWDRALPGEALVLDGSHSFFVADEIDDVIEARLRARDVHPSGPLWGRGELPSRGEARLRDERAAAEYPDLARGLEAAGLEQDRRSLRLVARDMDWCWDGERALELRFALPPGSYATTVVAALAQTAADNAEIETA